MTDQLPLALVAPSPHRLYRRSDSGASAVAAAEIVESGAETTQVLLAIGLVTSLPGRTSAELADETKEIGARMGFDRREWRYVLGRRLSTAEDEGRGPIIGSERRFKPEKWWRRVDPGQGAQIRWWPKGDAR